MTVTMTTTTMTTTTTMVAVAMLRYNLCRKVQRNTSKRRMFLRQESNTSAAYRWGPSYQLRTNSLLLTFPRCRKRSYQLRTNSLLLTFPQWRKRSYQLRTNSLPLTFPQCRKRSYRLRMNSLLQDKLLSWLRYRRLLLTADSSHLRHSYQNRLDFYPHLYLLLCKNHISCHHNHHRQEKQQKRSKQQHLFSILLLHLLMVFPLLFYILHHSRHRRCKGTSCSTNKDFRQQQSHLLRIKFMNRCEQCRNHS